MDLAGDVGPSPAPTNLGTSEVVAEENLDCSGEDARSEFNVTGSGIDVLFTGVSGLSPSPSGTTDCLLTARCSSSSSSAISMRRRRRSELVEDEVDAEAACNEQAAESLESFNSSATAISKMVSYGENRSQTALKWTATRAKWSRRKCVSISSSDEGLAT